MTYVKTKYKGYFNPGELQFEDEAQEDEEQRKGILRHSDKEAAEMTEVIKSKIFRFLKKLHHLTDEHYSEGDYGEALGTLSI